jgi:hypothetical protein
MREMREMIVRGREVEEDVEDDGREGNLNKGGSGKKCNKVGPCQNKEEE